MSMKRLTWVRPSAAAQARRSSTSVSGPKVVNVSSPPGLSTRRHSRKTASGSLHHCSIRLLKTRSAAAVAQRQRRGVGADALEPAQQGLPPPRLPQHALGEVERHDLARR